MSLKEYRAKRDFDRTPEPSGGGKGKGRAARLIFTVQRHDASRLHYDFRLQVGDALASWAVPKGPSLDPAHKRLAVHVEDHPLDYADFEGNIPAGEYGGGSVMLWDTGTWEPDDPDPAKAIGKGRLSFTLHGRRLKGGWTLTRLTPDRNGSDSRDNWLLIKRDDDHADTGDLVTERHQRSIKSRRTQDQIAALADGKKKARRKAASKKNPGAGKATRRAAAKAPDPSGVKGVRKRPIPRDLSPQLCTLADSAPGGEAWVHEIKFDGYRLIARKDGASVRLITRAGKDWTARFGPIAEAIAALPAQQAVVDGEACIVDAQGRSSFQALQQAIKAGRFGALTFFAFDLLYLDAHDLRSATLLDRKALLRELLPEGHRVLRYSDHVAGAGPRVQAEACELALEGIICKRADAPYEQRRSRSWLKVKCSRRQEFVVIGYSPPTGSRRHFGSLLLGAYDVDRLVYTGRVGTGFNAAALADIKTRLDRLERKTCPADEPPDPAEQKGVTWVTPELVAEVEFTEWTDDGRLRHPSFQGLREDKPAREVRMESLRRTAATSPPPSSPERKRRVSKAPARSTASKTRKATAGRTPSRSAPPDDPRVAGVRISSPDRVLFPEAGITKLQLAEYYESVADRILPFLTGRPLSTVRCPSGRAATCFFQKHLRETFSDPVRAIRVTEKDGQEEDYIAVDSVEGLITLVQFGVIEIHPWGSTERDIDHPDQLTIDLDPGEGVSWEQVKEGVRRVRAELARCGLESFPKFTGGKGLHAVVPIRPDADWEAAKSFCHCIAREVSRQWPGEYLTKSTKAARKGKVFIDYLRNGRGATSIAPYSARARPGAPVAVPLRWEELGKLDRDQYTITTLPRRLSRLRRDPWAGYAKARQRLDKATLALCQDK